MNVIVREQPISVEGNAEEAAALLKSVANPHRIKILCRLACREHSVSELESIVELSQSALSQHLARLRKDNLVSTRRSAQTIYYSIEDVKVEHLLQCLSRLYADRNLSDLNLSEPVSVADTIE